METASSAWIERTAAVVRKDLQAEFRTRVALNALLLFAVTSLAVVSFTVTPTSLKSDALAALFWVVIFFSSMTGLGRVFAHEEESHTADALRLAAPAHVVYLGKWVFNLLLLAGVEIVLIPLFIALFGVQVASGALFVVVVVLGSIGLCAGCTTVAAIVAHARARNALYAVLSFPIVLPALVMSVRGTQTALDGGGFAAALPELKVLLSYAVVVLTLSLILFEYVWNE